ncbi:general stress protein [Paenibacillus agricola]|uniref:General stress protein n=1 Tax=Paenibacillus agricola TaxID=2716264 RepID=A0ABX0J246_9BACL|nr:general stress protein [Paenibacillus agricola]NHN29748.1 general stress protein [Paenibacillus agricola]
MNNKVRLVTHEEQAISEIRAFQQEGYTLEEIYVIAHDNDTTEGFSKLMSTKTVGIYEEGITNAFANLFRSRGDQLRVKLQSLGLSKDEADFYEKELDKGKIMVMAWIDDNDFDDWVPETKDSIRRSDAAIIAPAGVYTTQRTGSTGIW